ncbi:hypothetical protein CASFOL_000391 [Castilleja foliolosa]|uniref:Uncharacterized protein n=1 Tax=Castilleja foliolosa TaxID=1961234 RepID=A0ABD3ENJ8_9LAMI
MNPNYSLVQDIALHYHVHPPKFSYVPLAHQILDSKLPHMRCRGERHQHRSVNVKAESRDCKGLSAQTPVEEGCARSQHLNQVRKPSPRLVSCAAASRCTLRVDIYGLSSTARLKLLLLRALVSLMFSAMKFLGQLS